MPVTLVDTQATVQGDMLVATATAVIINATGTELGRVPVTAQVNKDLSANDPNRRGLKVNAKPRLRQLLKEAAIAAAAQVKAQVAEAAKVTDLAALVQADLDKEANL